jgi:hypothetical protein
MSRLSTDLTQLYDEYTQPAPAPGDLTSAAAFQPAHSSLEIANGHVDVEVATSSSANLAALATQLHDLGATVRAFGDVRVTAQVPIGKLPQVASLSAVTAVQPCYAPTTNAAGPVAVQGDNAMYAYLVQQYLGYTGAGQTVGVISDSFNEDYRVNGIGSYLADQESGALPGPYNPIPGDHAGGQQRRPDRHAAVHADRAAGRPAPQLRRCHERHLLRRPVELLRYRP